MQLLLLVVHTLKKGRKSTPSFACGKRVISDLSVTIRTVPYLINSVLFYGFLLVKSGQASVVPLVELPRVHDRDVHLHQTKATQSKATRGPEGEKIKVERRSRTKEERKSAIKTQVELTARMKESSSNNNIQGGKGKKCNTEVQMEYAVQTYE